MATAILWIRIFTVAAAICTTSVPVIYAFYPWYTKGMGRVFMAQAVAFALALDISAIFSIWRPRNIWFIFVADLFILTGIGASTVAMAIFMWRLNHPRIVRIGRHRKDDNGKQNVQRS